MTCIKCGKPAKKVWRIDIDTIGIGMCNKCEEDVTFDIVVANIGGVKGWEKFGKKYFPQKKKSRPCPKSQKINKS